MQYLTEVICFLSFNKQKITVKKVFKPPKLSLSHFDNTGFSCQIRFKTCQYCHAIFGGRGMGEGGALLKVYQLKIMPIISYIAPKGYLYPIPRARSNYTLKPVKSVVIIYPS